MSKKTGAMYRDIPCQNEGCDVVMRNVYFNTRYCPACLEKRKAEQYARKQAEYNTRKRAKEQAEKEAVKANHPNKSGKIDRKWLEGRGDMEISRYMMGKG